MVDAVMGKAKDGGAVQQKSNDLLKQFEGRTGITKLNSTQVFTGMPPVKIQVTALLRAWRDSASEVEAPLRCKSACRQCRGQNHCRWVVSADDNVQIEIGAIRQSLAEVKSALTKIAEVLDRLTRLEERHSNTASTLERAYMVSDWVLRGVWAALGMGGTLVVKQLLG